MASHQSKASDGPKAGLTRKERARAPGPCPTRGHCVLRVEEMAKAFHRGVWPRRRTVEVLKGASLMVCRGELVGLVGENGSGKSTMMQIIVGLLGRDEGSVEQPERLGYCPQTPMLWEKLTVDEHFALFARAYDLDQQARERSVGGLLAELQCSWSSPGSTWSSPGRSATAPSTSASATSHRH